MYWNIPVSNGSFGVNYSLWKAKQRNFDYENAVLGDFP